MSKITLAQFQNQLVRTDNVPSVEGAKVPRTIRPLKKTPIKPLNERILLVDPAVGEERMNICKSCESFEDWGCKVTNNFLPKTTRQKGMHCPKGYWASKWD
jgi:hypothetical protein